MLDRLSELFTDRDFIILSQKRDISEAFIPIEVKNRYHGFSKGGKLLFSVFEESGSWFSRQLLKSARPFTISVVDSNNKVLFKVVRPFRFYFHEATVTNPAGKKIGSIEREFGLLTRRYLLLDSSGSEKYEIAASIFSPWTFPIMSHSDEIAMVKKKWKGLTTEFFTDADNFGIQFNQEMDAESKALILATVLLLDFIYFEGNHGSAAGMVFDLLNI